MRTAAEYIERPVLLDRPHSNTTARWWRLPRPCAVCRSWTDAALCSHCTARLRAIDPGCLRCALPLLRGQALCQRCATAAPTFDASLAAVRYEAPWDQLIAQFKFASQPRLAGLLSARMQAAIDSSPVDHPAHPAFLAELGLPRWILPIPLSAQRLRERGYNQAWELARRLATPYAMTADARLLLRLHDPAHQVGLNREARLRNLSGGFAVDPMRRRALAGSAVVLVDDVMTTGATLTEAARVLKQAGARHVVCWIVARTERSSRHPGPADGPSPSDQASP